MYAHIRSLAAALRRPLLSLDLSHPIDMSLQHHNSRRRSYSINAINNEPIHILGIGNLGKLIAHSLAKSSPAPPVILLFHRPEMASHWDEAGRYIDVVTRGSSDKQYGFRTEIVSRNNDDVKISSIIKNLVVTTKSHATAAALQPLQHRLTSASTILFLQNGMGR